MFGRLHYAGTHERYVFVEAQAFKLNASSTDASLERVSYLEARRVLESMAREEPGLLQRVYRVVAENDAWSRASRLSSREIETRIDRLLGALGYRDGSPSVALDFAHLTLLRPARTSRPLARRQDGPESVAIEQALDLLGNDALVLRGDSYRLAQAHDARVSQRDMFETLSEQQLFAIVDELANDPRRAETRRTQLAKLLTLATAQREKRGSTDLLLLRRRRSLTRASEERPASVTPSQLRKELHWIEVRAMDEEQKPIAGVELELTLADGSVRALRTRDDGFARVDHISGGDVTIRVPRLDGSAWRALGGASASSSGRRGPSHSHSVRQGECLAKIAHRYGYRDWRKLWDDAQNEALRAKRKDPDVLLPGDRVVIPGVDIHEIVRATDATHALEIARSKLHVRVRFQDLAGNPIEDLSYQLRYQLGEMTVEKPGAAPSDASGLVKESVPLSVDALALKVGEQQRLRLVHRASSLDPSHDEGSETLHHSAIRRRLRALGYAPSTEREPGKAATRDIALFQQLQMGRDKPNGELDQDTLTALLRAHAV